MKVRKSLAAGLLAASTLLVVAGCSDDNSDNVSNATNQASAALNSAAGKASAAVGSAAEKAKSAASSATAAVVGLTNNDAQVIIRKAVDPATSETDLSGVVVTTDPATLPALQAYAKSSNAAGYTPEVYTVKSVKAQGPNKATVTTAIKSPHAPEPIDMTLTYEKVDGQWKLSSESVSQLASMGSQHGG